MGLGVVPPRLNITGMEQFLLMSSPCPFMHAINMRVGLNIMFDFFGKNSKQHGIHAETEYLKRLRSPCLDDFQKEGCPYCAMQLQGKKETNITLEIVDLKTQPLNSIKSSFSSYCELVLLRLQ